MSEDLSPPPQPPPPPPAPPADKPISRLENLRRFQRGEMVPTTPREKLIHEVFGRPPDKDAANSAVG